MSTSFEYMPEDSRAFLRLIADVGGLQALQGFIGTGRGAVHVLPENQKAPVSGDGHRVTLLPYGLGYVSEAYGSGPSLCLTRRGWARLVNSEEVGLEPHLLPEPEPEPEEVGEVATPVAATPEAGANGFHVGPFRFGRAR